MPVIGHAFVGLATAIEAAPATGLRRNPAIWAPGLVALAYLPDIVGRAVAFFRPGPWREMGHSVLLAVPLALISATGLVLLFGLTWRRSAVVASVSLGAHIGLDLLSGDHLLLWPASSASIGLSLAEEARAFILELLVFPALFVLFLLVRRVWTGHHPSGEGGSSAAAAFRTGGWSGVGLTALILVAASVTHGLGWLRHHQMAAAWNKCRQRDFAGALVLFDRASCWPAMPKPGRVDYARAEAHWAMGNRAAAEEYYLRSYRADPSYFWCVVDLANLYASAGQPLEWRRRHAEPYLQRLRTEFTDQPERLNLLARIDRKLGLEQPTSMSAAVAPSAVTVPSGPP
ncbi:MAG: hypothetical protein HY718_11045 [Planctomycetes bacterium]|nr:hypothetical protein [Planctomycetota bacterium]